MKVESLISYPLKLASEVTGIAALLKAGSLATQHGEGPFFKGAFRGIMGAAQVLFPYSTHRLLSMLEDLDKPNLDLFTLRSSPLIVGDVLSSSVSYALATNGHIDQAIGLKLVYNTIVNAIIDSYHPIRRFFSRNTLQGHRYSN